MNIVELFKRRTVIFDGGLGSLLQEKGLPAGELPERWNISRPELLVDIHSAYLAAGADIVTTNSFGANRLKYGDTGEYSLENIVKAAVNNAKAAIERQREGGECEAFVALDLGPTGKLLKPMGELSFEDAVELYAEVVRYGAAAGADFALLETMGDCYEAKAAIIAVKENSSLPVMATMAFDENGRLLTGGDVESAVALLEGLGVDALGANCGMGPVQMKTIAEKLLSVASVPVIVNANAGLPRSENGKTLYDISSDEFAQSVFEIAKLGASAVGGCCGTTPEYIKKVSALCKGLPAPEITPKRRSVVCSGSRAMQIGEIPVVIGERINPTGKAKFKQALREHDINYLLGEGVSQEEHGADILDVNVGLPEIDEAQMMEDAVRELQGVCALPLQIDTTDKAALERALRVYNGKALVNSVNGKLEEMEKVFPLVKKYGGVVVALTLDENGIPETAEGRVAVARKICEKAAEYEIAPENIVVDCLCMTISTDGQSALTTLEALSRVKSELGLKTILGVSNISFGLPQREAINSAFLTMALQAGLDAAIINPNSDAMMRTLRSYKALAGLDSSCAGYIEAYGGQTGAAAAQIKDTAEKKSRSLGDCVLRGLKDEAASSAGAELESRAALDVINEELIPALNIVGERFENGTMFLPQLLMSAEAAGAAFSVIKERLSAGGQERERRGKVVLATVKGDIHDIGKNIVKVLLDNYSFEVIDLGKDVAPERIVDTVLETGAKLVGLSALMTTTVPSMAETIKLVREKAPEVKVMVGGAVLTKEYADAIGADFYGKDAMASVRYAEQLGI